MSGVVVDTSVWIDFLSGRPAGALEDALRQGVVVLPPLVISELISGARSTEDQAALTDLLRQLHMHEATFAHWVRVGQLRNRCKANGLSVSTPDAHVAQCALDRDALLLSRDRVFTAISSVAGLRLYAGR